MKHLFDFIAKYYYWVLFVFLEAVCFLLLFSFNSYQHSVYFTSANRVAASVYEVTGTVKSYFGLRTVNEELLERNSYLEQKNAILQEYLRKVINDTLRYNSLDSISQSSFYDFPALVINNSINKADNYLTIDVGKSDGIKPEMGVVGSSGVVGIVYKTSQRYSLVISLLNSKSNVSCKIKGSDYFGYLRWEGHDSHFAYLKDLPRHAEFQVGDSVVTSGFSAVFPEGIMVGVVDEMKDSNDGLSYIVKVKLSTDYGNIGNVRVVFRKDQEELIKLENQG